jgi:D-alanine-D-alanine ligase
VVRAAGVPVAPGAVVRSEAEALLLDPPGGLPCFVKPRWEGSSKGIGIGSRVEDRAALAAAVQRVVERYRQPALVEGFLPGPEYTVTLLGNDPTRALPVLQRALEATSRIGLHAVEPKPGEIVSTPLGQPDASEEPASAAEGGARSEPQASEVDRHAAAQQPDRPQADVELPHILPGHLDPSLDAELAGLARRAFEALECRDFARVDFKCDAGGSPCFLEINPLPSFAPTGSFGVHAELLGRTLPDLLAEALAGGLQRLGLS